VASFFPELAAFDPSLSAFGPLAAGLFRFAHLRKACGKAFTPPSGEGSVKNAARAGKRRLWFTLQAPDKA
jgi:hypothetical protein